MACLVADYSDSDDDENPDSSVVSGNALDLTSPSKVGSKIDLPTSKPTTSNFFGSAEVGPAEDDSSDGSDPESDDEGEPSGLNSSKMSLPPPDIAFQTSGRVFNTSYSLQEKAKESILEQHVKMTAKKVATIKPVCFKFKKGKCNKGSSCRFLHETGFVVPLQVAPDPAEDGDTTIHKQTKRPGVTNTMQPAKKAKQSLDKFRTTDRPWTVNKNKT